VGAIRQTLARDRPVAAIENRFEAWIYREGTRQVWVAETTYRVMPGPPSPKLPDLAAWARGYFDAEGGVPRDNGARFYVQFVQKNRADLECLKSVLESLGLQCGELHTPSVRVDPDYCRVYVAASSQMVFIRTVGSWHPRKRSLLERRKSRDVA
jgi:hypothetical protein